MTEPAFYINNRGWFEKLFTFMYHPTVIGAENIPESGRIVIAGNHTHFWDCVMVGFGTQRCVHFLAKDDLMKPPLKYIFDKLGIIPVNRRAKDKHALASAIEVLEDDKVIGIFPEGKVKTKDECHQNVILPFKYGAVKMAQVTNSKIVPFSITGKYKLFRKRIQIEFFEPIEITEDLSESNERLMAIVEKGILSSDKFVYKEYHGDKIEKL